MDSRTSNRILVGIVVAIVLAFASVAAFGEAMTSVEWLGTLFLKALKMIIVPLVMASMIWCRSIMSRGSLFREEGRRSGRSRRSAQP